MGEKLCGQDQIFTTDQLKNDFRIFRKSLEEAHPGLYRYHSKAEMDKSFDKGESLLTRPGTVFELYKPVAAIVSTLGCGHTIVRLSDDFYKNHNLQVALPFNVRILDGRVYVNKVHATDVDIPLGAKIISIDGSPIKVVIESMLPYISHDGFIEVSRYKTLERYFSRFLRIYFKEADFYQIKFQGLSGAEFERKVKVIPVSNIAQEELKPALEFKILNESTGVMTIQSFAGGVTDNKGNAYSDFLKNSFSEAKKNKIKNLIIDLRGNGGGNDNYGSLLFSYLTDKPFQYYQYLEMNKPSFSFLEYTRQPPDFGDRFQSILTKTTDGRYNYIESAHPCLPVQRPQPDFYNENVFVLIDGNSFSATSEFAAIARDKKRAIFLGEETGGAYEGNTSGGNIELVLPETKLKVYLPLLKYVSAVRVDSKSKGRGIIPDIEVKQTIQGVLSGRDEVMEKALEQIRK